MGACEGEMGAGASRVVVFTDPNQDPDDDQALAVLASLHRRGVVELVMCVTTLGDEVMRAARARHCRGLLDALGLTDVDVRVGRAAREPHDAVFHDTPFVAGPTPPAFSLADLEGSGPWMLLVIAGMTDAADVLEHLVARGESVRLVVQGGQARQDGRPTWTPNGLAFNNQSDPPSARTLFRCAEAHGVSTVVLEREAAYAAAVSLSFHEALAATGHVLGVHIRDVQRAALASHWRAVVAGELVGRDATWFGEVFCGEPLSAALSFEEVWPKIRSVNLYDPLAVLACIPGGLNHFRGVQVGALRVLTDVVDADRTRAWLLAALTEALTAA